MSEYQKYLFLPYSKKEPAFETSVLILWMPYHPSFEIRILYILYNHTIRKSHIHILAFTIRNNLCFKSAFHNSLFADPEPKKETLTKQQEELAAIEHLRIPDEMRTMGDRKLSREEEINRILALIEDEV